MGKRRLQAAPPGSTSTSASTASSTTSLTPFDYFYGEDSLPAHPADWTSSTVNEDSTVETPSDSDSDSTLQTDSTVTQSSTPTNDKKNSAIHYVDEDDPSATATETTTTTSATSTSKRRTREGHLLVLLPLTRDVQKEDDSRTLLEFRVYVELAAFLAHQHIQHRSGLVLPNVQRRLRDQHCDFSWTYQHYDTRFSPFHAVKGINDAYHHHHDTHKERPFAVMGAASSAVSSTLATIGAAMEIPQITSSSTASTLDRAPLAARTITSNRGDAHAIMAYFHFINVKTVSLLFLDDSWGRNYQNDFQQYAHQYNITLLHSIPYLDVNPHNLDVALNQVQQAQSRYWIGILAPSQWKPVVRKAYQWGLMGHDNPDKYQWFLPDLVELRGDAFALDANTETDIALAIHGIGMPFIQLKPNQALDRALASVATDTKLQQAFIQHHAEPHIFDNFTFTHFPGRSVFQYLTYDAVMALGITACETPGLFSAKEFYDNLRNIDFQGVSGRVRLDPVTGTRSGDAFSFEMVNLLLKDYNNNGDDAEQGDTANNKLIFFEARSSATIDLAPVLNANNNTDINNQTAFKQQPLPSITIINPFVFHDNTTTPPPELPHVEHYMNLIPIGLRVFGIALAGLVMLLSVACGLWTILYRKRYVVRAAQPFFLIAICIGTFVLSFTVVLLSFQEDMSQQTLDAGCLMIPWTLCIGYTVTIASLYSKADRINKVMNSGARRGRRQGFRRVRIKPSDVLWPAFVLLHMDLGFLVSWTFSPFRMAWHRVYIDNYDSLGRQIESYGACRPDDGSQWYLLFAIPLYLTKLLVLARATLASYHGRDLPTEFSETKYLIVALVSLCETVVLGAIPMVAVMEDPTSFFVVSTLVIVIGCLSILLPVFLPKYWQRHAKEPKGRKAISLLQAPQVANKYTWRRLEPARTLEDAECEESFRHRPSGSFSSNFGSSLSSFLASAPAPIKRISDSTAGSKGSNGTSASSSADALKAVGSAGYQLVKGPAIVAKAIIVSTFTTSSQEDTAEETLPNGRLEVLFEEEDESTRGSVVDIK
ncbi:Gamma-aminobutyric acid (GABA) B receptor [Seminavis robusta]|uniref:Gamma-aminobutyric acid (GABA) B receptor n=1 Tax=Seminavis robusta TaxID=568900 RepID=A0A9N8HU92_9STRA|nr:Gamma-aminobutyric acid (GABA) B receptor [Seminavis robusta]|eukprot:Sro1778_g296990.1 Gamma-aminobutyric acid (GABA) B receptor (1048) ;mRNA; f:15098-18469